MLCERGIFRLKWVLNEFVFVNVGNSQRLFHITCVKAFWYTFGKILRFDQNKTSTKGTIKIKDLRVLRQYLHISCSFLQLSKSKNLVKGYFCMKF